MHVFSMHILVATVTSPCT